MREVIKTTVKEYDTEGRITKWIETIIEKDNVVINPYVPYIPHYPTQEPLVNPPPVFYKTTTGGGI
jgi:hypothetical protein